MNVQEVLEFWFEELTPQQWYKKDPELDHLIGQRFGPTLDGGSKGELSGWRDTLPGRLAEIIVLDQFSRNIYRDQPQAFASDPVALVLAQEAITRCDVIELPVVRRTFLYMPFMHSESLVVHDWAVRLFTELGSEDNLNYEHKHRDIIKQFGRYPHRNAILVRASTEQELEFLRANPGF
mgnify:CR=1 FL=1|jgi:uncharacterized protein (DUF924 family)|tara:strand:+ start:494 stop:1030 length:537 start_codon:yes stop_codon:yes gene_type:complete